MILNYLQTQNSDAYVGLPDMDNAISIGTKLKSNTLAGSIDFPCSGISEVISKGKNI